MAVFVGSQYPPFLHELLPQDTSLHDGPRQEPSQELGGGGEGGGGGGHRRVASPRSSRVFTRSQGTEGAAVRYSISFIFSGDIDAFQLNTIPTRRKRVQRIEGSAVKSM